MEAMPPHPRFLVLLAATTLALTAQDQAEIFEKKIRPILAARCAGCHNQKLKTAGLDLSTGEGFMAAGVSGALVDRSNPGESRL